MPPRQELDLVDICQDVFVQHGNTLPIVGNLQVGSRGPVGVGEESPEFCILSSHFPWCYYDLIGVNHIFFFFLNLEIMGHRLRDRQRLFMVAVKSGAW